MSDDLILVATASNQAEADIWLALLKGEGIPVLVRNMFGESSIERTAVLYSGLRIYVAAHDYGAARELLGVSESPHGPVGSEANTRFWIVVLALFALAISAVVALLGVLA